MIQINLLPVREQIKEESARHFVITYLLSVVLALAVIGYVWQFQSRQFRMLEKRIGKLEQERSRYSKYDLMLKELKKEKEVIDKKRKIIQSLQVDRDRMARTLALFALMVPADRMWFDKFSCAGGAVNLSGIALSDEAIAEFMRNLQTSPYIVPGSVNLSHTRLKVINGMKLREFRLSCQVLPYSKVRKKLEAKRAVSDKVTRAGGA